MQLDLNTGDLASPPATPGTRPLRSQLLKWVGNKQRFASTIAGFLPQNYRVYREPFLGSGAVLGTLAPPRAVGADALLPLVQIWQTLASDLSLLVGWYRERWNAANLSGKAVGYERIKASYNANPNPADLLFVARACYGGIVRFRQRDGYISTPCGVHQPISPESFGKRASIWAARIKGTDFVHSDFEAVMEDARRGDVVYCDPPYSHTQSILYGAQSFELDRLFRSIDRCKTRGVFVALSIDGSKRSGDLLCDIAIPDNLFEREVLIDVGRSMLRRFQMRGESLQGEKVKDRLLLTQ